MMHKETVPKKKAGKADEGVSCPMKQCPSKKKSMPMKGMMK